MKSIKILIALITVAVLTFFLAPHLVNLDKYINLSIKSAEEKIGKALIIQGKPTIDISSEIRITLPNFLIVNKTQTPSLTLIQADSLVLYISPHNFLFGNNKINKIEINNPTINLDYFDNFHSFITMHQNADFAEFVINNGVIWKHNSSYITKLNTITNLHSSKLSTIKGNFVIDNNVLNISANISKPDAHSTQALTLNIYNQYSSIDAKATLKRLDNKLEMNGDIKFNIDGTSLIIDYFTKLMPFISNMKKNHLDDPIIISANFDHKDNYTNVTNLKINSKDINGTGNLTFATSGNSNIKAYLDFDKINFNEILSLNKSTLASSNQIYIEDSSNNFRSNDYADLSFLNSSDADIKINIKEINIQNITLNDFVLDFGVMNQKVTNGSIIFNIAGKGVNSKFSISNLSLHSIDYTNVLLGTFENSGNNINDTSTLFGLNDYFLIEQNNLDYSVNSQIIISDEEISLFNLVGKIGNDGGTLSGNIASRVDQMDNYNIDLNFDKINLDNINLPLFKTRFKSLMRDSDKDDYLTKFIWFRTLSSNYSIKFSFTNTNLKNQKIDNLVVLCNLSPAKMQLKGLIKSSFLSSDFALNLEALDIKPTIKIVVTGDNLDYDALMSVSSNLFDTNSDIDSSQNEELWSSNKLNIFKINKYAAIFEIGLKKVKVKNYNLNNFILYSHTSGDILYIDNLNFNIYNGIVQSGGNISFFTPALYQFSFSGSNIDSKNLFADNLSGLTAFDGPLSFTTSFITDGDSPKDLIANLNMSINFASSGMTLNGIDSDVVVDIALQRKSLPKDSILSNIDLSLSSGSTLINNLSGSMKGSKGILNSSDVTFQTRFNNAASALTIDLNKLTLSSNTQFLFMPYTGSPITYNIITNGNLRGPLQSTIDDKGLVKFVKDTYGIVTQEDIAEAKKLRRKAQQQPNNPNNLVNDPSDQKYLYYKLIQEDAAAREQAENNSLSNTEQ